MADSFHLSHQREGDLEVVRWIGDPELAGWARHDLWGSGSPRFVDEYTMTGGTGLLYPALLGLVWHLTEGLQRLALPIFDGVIDCERARLPYELVRWEYGIDWEQADWRLRDQGFVPAEHLSPVAESGDEARFTRRPGAGLAPVQSWSELMAITPFGDQANSLCLIAVEPGEESRDRLMTCLLAESSPRIDEVVTADEQVFAVITHEDEGLGLSSLVIFGRGRLRRLVPEHEARLNERVAAYLAETAAAATQQEWLSAVDRLAR